MHSFLFLTLSWRRSLSYRSHVPWKLESHNSGWNRLVSSVFDHRGKMRENAMQKEKNRLEKLVSPRELSPSTRASTKQYFVWGTFLWSQRNFFYFLVYYKNYTGVFNFVINSPVTKKKLNQNSEWAARRVRFKRSWIFKTCS